jgi:hypothetical protein
MARPVFTCASCNKLMAGTCSSCGAWYCCDCYNWHCDPALFPPSSTRTHGSCLVTKLVYVVRVTKLSEGDEILCF